MNPAENPKINRISEIVKAYHDIKKRYRFNSRDEQLMVDIQMALTYRLPFAHIVCDNSVNPPLDDFGEPPNVIFATVNWVDYPVTPTSPSIRLIFGEGIDIEYSTDKDICFKCYDGKSSS